MASLGCAGQALADGCEMAVAQCHNEPVLAKRDQLPESDKFLESTLIFNTDNDVMLTKREDEILRLIVKGRTNKQIARQLSRSERTIEYHRNRLMRKMSAHNAAELVKTVLARGMV